MSKISQNKCGSHLNINVASGMEVLPNFINLDNSPFLIFACFFGWLSFLLSEKYRSKLSKFSQAITNKQIRIHNCKKRLPFYPGSVDHILCSHFLEHVYFSEVDNILADFYLALRVGGTVHIVVPDLNCLIYDYTNADGSVDPLVANSFVESLILSSKNPPKLMFRVLDFFGSFGLNHKWMYTKSSIAEKIQNAGFVLDDSSGKESFPSLNFRRNDGSIHIFAIKN